MAYAPNGRTFLYGRQDGITVVAKNPFYQPPVASVTAASQWVLGGKTVQGTVTLSSPAPPYGATVQLASSNPSAATVPASVTGHQGQTSATFAVTTAPVATAAAVSISAVSFGASQSVTVNVLPQPSVQSVVLSPASIVGGGTTTANVVN